MSSRVARGGAALADMLAIVERFRPEVMVRETLEFSSDTDQRSVAMAAPAPADLRERGGLAAESAANAIVRSP